MLVQSATAMGRAVIAPMTRDIAAKAQIGLIKILHVARLALLRIGCELTAHVEDEIVVYSSVRAT